MAEIIKPSNLSLTWASAGDILDPGDTKYATGWEVEIPPRQWFNYLDNRQDKAIAHINQHGIAVWDATTDYEAANKSYVQGSDGKIYKSVAASGPGTVVQNPTTDTNGTYWVVSFQDVDTVRIDVASAGTVNLTTSAPNTRHINITGTTTISNFTVAAGKTYFVRFNAALTLTNSASLITQTGANIRTAAGDTCIMRAISTDVVEVMVFTDATVQSLSSNGYRKFKDGLILQWGTQTNTGTSTALVFPVTFPTAALSVNITPTATNLSVAGNYYQTAFLSMITTGFSWGSIDSAGAVVTTGSTVTMRWMAVGH